MVYKNALTESNLIQFVDTLLCQIRFIARLEKLSHGGHPPSQRFVLGIQMRNSAMPVFLFVLLELLKTLLKGYLG